MMSYTGWFLVELYYMMKRFGKRRIGKAINSMIPILLFIFALLLLGQNIPILFLFFSILAIFIFMKTVVLTGG